MSTQALFLAGSVWLFAGMTQAAPPEALTNSEQATIAQREAPVPTAGDDTKNPGGNTTGTEAGQPLSGEAIRIPVGAAEGTAQANLEQWLTRRLNQPTDRELKHERKGNVYIYDGLTDRDVDHALNAHFDRIEYMMFLGTRKTVPTDTGNHSAPGAAETESPGCM